MMCLRCGCNGKHLKADGSCLCGCPSLVTKWETTETVMQPPVGVVVPPSKDAGEAAAPSSLPFDDSDEKAKP